jgi:hypothetical protein
LRSKTQLKPPARIGPTHRAMQFVFTLTGNVPTQVSLMRRGVRDVVP